MSARSKTVWFGRASALLTALLHLAVLWLYLTSGLMAPLWAVAVLLVLWVLFAWAALVVHRRYGALSLVVPLVAVAVWFGVLTLGDLFLGWTA